MTYSFDRRHFLRTAAAAGAATAICQLAPAGAGAAEVKPSFPAAEKLGWRLACAMYTFRSMSFYEGLERLATLGIRGAEPAFFLPLSKEQPELKTNESLSPVARQQLQERLTRHGVRIVNFYSSLGANQEQNRKIFEFAKQFQIETLVAEPPPQAFEAIEKLCEEFQINMAVHNHPKSPQSQYWHPDNVLKACAGRGKRIGACCDTGHWVRSGLDPVECLKKMEGRIITFHLKDVIESGNPAARDVPLGTGKANYAAVLKELRRQGYRGVLSIEYEHQSPQLLEDVAQCAAFVEQTAQTL